jgi:outer membrane protein TolC
LRKSARNYRINGAKVKRLVNRSPREWVETFGDAQLNALVDTALANNYELKAAAARVSAAIAQARIDGSSRWPQFFLLPITNKFRFVRQVSVIEIRCV